MKRNAAAIAIDDPLRYVRNPAYQWSASQLEWWAVEGGFTYRIFGDIAIVGGLRREYFSFGLKDPRDPHGYPINATYPGPVIVQDTAASDFQLKLWVPYLGLRPSGPNYQAELNGSPFARVAVTIPEHFAQLRSQELPFHAWVFTPAQWQFSIFRTGGVYLEGDFEYALSLGPSLSMKGWVKGSWLKIRGAGNADQFLNRMVAIPPVAVLSGYAGEDRATATLTRYLAAVGIVAEVAF